MYLKSVSEELFIYNQVKHNEFYKNFNITITYSRQ